MDRYGPAIEYDLHALLGLDLLDWFRGVYPWGKLDRLLAQLPQGSAYWAARADDDEVAELYVAEHPERDTKPQRPPLNEQTRTNQLLAAAVDAVSTLVAQQATQMSGNTVKPAYLPSPQTAVDRAYKRAESAELDSLVAEAVAAIGRAEGQVAP